MVFKNGKIIIKERASPIRDKETRAVMYAKIFDSGVVLAIIRFEMWNVLRLQGKQTVTCVKIQLLIGKQT